MRRNASGVPKSLANGQLTLSRPNLAPPVCENVDCMMGSAKSFND